MAVGKARATVLGVKAIFVEYKHKATLLGVKEAPSETLNDSIGPQPGPPATGGPNGGWHWLESQKETAWIIPDRQCG